MKVYLTWYRNTETHRVNLWGIYSEAETAEGEKCKAEELGFIAWVNEEEVH